MLEPPAPLRVPLTCFAIVSLGIYVLFAAVMLEWYPLVPVAVLCFLAGGLPALSLTRRPS